MKKIETHTCTLTLMDQRTALVEVKYGIEIDSQVALSRLSLLDNHMPGHYGLIINRQQDYSFKPVEVYEVLNKHQKLSSIALVLYNKLAVDTAQLEKKLFQGKLEIFNTIEDAKYWLNSVIPAADSVMA